VAFSENLQPVTLASKRKSETDHGFLEQGETSRSDVSNALVQQDMLLATLNLLSCPTSAATRDPGCSLIETIFFDANSA